MAGISDLINRRLNRGYDESKSQADRVGVLNWLIDYLDDKFDNQDLAQVEFEVGENVTADVIDVIQDPKITSKYSIIQLHLNYFVATARQIEL